MRCDPSREGRWGDDRRGGAEAGEPVQLERAVCASGWRNGNSAAVKAWCKDFWRSAVGRHLRRNAGSNRDEMHSAFFGKQILSFFFSIRTSGCMIPIRHMNPH